MAELGNIISIKNLSIKIQDREILKDINLDIRKGEFVYLVGPTGGGKSTLLKSLYADQKISSGALRVVDTPVKDLKAAEIALLRRKIGIIFQDFQLLYDRRVDENLRFILKSIGWTDQQKIKNRIAEVLMKVGLSSAAAKYPYQLSGGEQQRVAIARALLNQPQLLIADEPTGNLDPETSRGIMKLFFEINKSGTTVFMATHNFYLINEIPGRIIFCKNGELKDCQLQELDQLFRY